ncbi:unnamed protein product [Phyllotreta striolata]|uniref:Uncharacterized protein n=1 Tax=Phyllotreta striolata TaxID=444603 RepID=A0A9N9TH08_PHYSR|nr:unnamed protein product [Phyllotreta striolata]
MRLSIAIFIAAFLSSAAPLQNEDGFESNLLKGLISKYENQKSLKDEGGITAVINDFADKLFGNIDTFAVKNGLDPIPLKDIKETFLLADIELLNGAIHGISTIERYEDVSITYQSKTKTLTVQLPIVFSNLSFTYDYKLLFAGLGPQGDLIGEIDHFKFYLVFSFNYNTLTAEIDTLRTTDSGHISLTVNGGITDIVFNILSEFFTTVFHPFIQGVIEAIIKTVANKIVTDVNDLIYNITHQNYSQRNSLGYGYPVVYLN